MNNQKKIIANNCINPAWLTMHGYTNTYAPESNIFSQLTEFAKRCSWANFIHFVRIKLFTTASFRKD